MKVQEKVKIFFKVFTCMGIEKASRYERLFLIIT